MIDYRSAIQTIMIVTCAVLRAFQRRLCVANRLDDIFMPRKGVHQYN